MMQQRDKPMCLRCLRVPKRLFPELWTRDGELSNIGMCIQCVTIIQGGELSESREQT